MDFKLYSDIKTFYNDVYGVLMRHEAQNMIPLGNLIIGRRGEDKSGWRDPANWFMAAVSDGTGIRLTAIMTPPHNLTLYATDNRYGREAINCLVNGIIGADIAVGGVMTESALAEDFARVYTAAKGLKYAVYKSQRIYELTSVGPDTPVTGSLRPARESDLAFLPYWTGGFNFDCFGTPPEVGSDIEQYRHIISAGKRYILEDDGTPVSMAAVSREMETACGVGQVYTPPYFRGRGYASACVAALSQMCLERGFARCVLYTDLANPTSNSIYQKIGYVPICDSLDIKVIDNG